MDHVTIQIPAMYFDVLSKWASVSRTLSQVQALLNDLIDTSQDDTQIEQAQHTLDEVTVLKPSLDAVNAACKEAKHRIQRTEQQEAARQEALRKARSG